MLLHTSPLVEATVRPEETRIKLHREWLADPTPEPRELPGVDVAALKRKYGPQRMYAPRMLQAIFQVPLQVREATFAKEQAQQVYKWITKMEKDGWTWCKDRKVQVYPHRYPARDFSTGVDILDRRDFAARAWFTRNHPEIIRTEIKPEWLETVRL